MSQNYSPDVLLQGYTLAEDSITFIYDPKVYSTAPEKVVVTGEFRNWDQDMDEQDWQLHKSNGIWTLTKNNEAFSLLKPNGKFKFRIDDGLWQNPPEDAPNVQRDDLLFMPNDRLSFFKAEIRDESTVWVLADGFEIIEHLDDFRLTDAVGNEVPLATALPNNRTEYLISTKEPIDKKRVYFLSNKPLKLKTHCSFDGWFRELYSSKELGANIIDDNTIIRLFAPRATMVKVYLYHDRLDVTPYRTTEMVEDDDGVWEIHYEENLHGVYYDFTVHGSKDPGNHFYESNPIHITDPYARISDNTWGKARIWHKGKAADKLRDGIPKMQDVIAYEVHVQDFTDQLPVPTEIKGTFRAMTTPGLRNSLGRKIGFDYLLDIGINVLHLMPVQEYLHFPDEDWKASYQYDPYMVEQGVSEENYQWGYRTSHFFAVESKYRTKGSEPGTEREEFRDLIQAFHDKGIAVIIDIVPNHTAENMDDNELYFNFNVIDKLYYYRTLDFDHIGEYGNEVKTENRPMVQRWLIDQCQHFIDEFGVDGFRIDLAGQIDKQTLIALREALDDDIIIYGEPWIGSNDPDFESNPDWDWYKHDSPITFFQDDQRNAYKGPVFELKDKRLDRGWVGGKYSERINVMKGLSAGFPDDKTPLSGISYLDIHDNFALADQFGTDNFDGRLSVDQDLFKIACTLLYTTLGPIVTHGGTEIMRSKAHAPLKEVIKKTKAGFASHFHGYRDTYNHRRANQFVWETVGQKPQGNNKNDYQGMHDFWKGMNAFRLSQYGEVFRQAEAVGDDYFHWILPHDDSKLGYIVDAKVMVLLNAGNQEFTFDNIRLPKGEWKLIAYNEKVDHHNGIQGHTYTYLDGGQEQTLTLRAEGLHIWARELE